MQFTKGGKCLRSESDTSNNYDISWRRRQDAVTKIRQTQTVKQSTDSHATEMQQNQPHQVFLVFLPHDSSPFTRLKETYSHWQHPSPPPLETPAYVEVEPENEDHVTQNVDAAEGDEHVLLEVGEELLAFLGEDCNRRLQQG